MITEELKTLQVHQLEPRLKHPTVFEWFARLAPGESFILENDHDPKPLYYQILAELGPVFSWNYTSQGPQWWTVVIGKNETGELTVGEIAARDARKAEAMKKMGVDFCCGGKKTLKQAAADAGISHADLQKALTETASAAPSFELLFADWDPDFLANYIYNQHHKYYYRNKEEIAQLAAKVLEVHGQHHAELLRLSRLIAELFSELDTHFMKEEKVLFPYINKLVEHKRNGTHLHGDKLNLTKGPLAMMYSEHEAAGDFLRSIREVTHDFQLPDGACNSYRALYGKLEALEVDLHQHIHLENNILFPKAKDLERELSSCKKPEHEKCERCRDLN